VSDAAPELRNLVAELYGDTPAAAIARMANNNGGDEGCTACRFGQCEPISCWVIVVIIIVIIVTK
jgi:t-SNARE complex subunit (syntaxin)